METVLFIAVCLAGSCENVPISAYENAADCWKAAEVMNASFKHGTEAGCEYEEGE